jgi:hypothetical protein
VRTLSEQVKFLSLNTPSAVAPLHHQLQGHNSPGPNTQHATGNLNAPHLRQVNIPPVNPAPTNYTQGHGTTFPSQQTQPPPPPPVLHGAWFGQTGIAAPQASHPAAPPPPPAPHAPLAQRTPPNKTEDWDEMYLAVLGSQDSRQLRELLGRSNPEIVMPLNGPGPLSQAVVLTLLHRVSRNCSGEGSFFLMLFFYRLLRWLERHRRLTSLSSHRYGGCRGRLRR